jgi:hypothetical protein
MPDTPPERLPFAAGVKNTPGKPPPQPPGLANRHLHRDTQRGNLSHAVSAQATGPFQDMTADTPRKEEGKSCHQPPPGGRHRQFAFRGLRVEHEDELLDAVVGCRRLRLLRAIPPEGALFQDPDRADVVHRDVSIQWPGRHRGRPSSREDAARPVPSSRCCRPPCRPPRSCAGCWCRRRGSWPSALRTGPCRERGTRPSRSLPGRPGGQRTRRGPDLRPL